MRYAVIVEDRRQSATIYRLRSGHRGTGAQIAVTRNYGYGAVGCCKILADWSRANGYALRARVTKVGTINAEGEPEGWTFETLGYFEPIGYDAAADQITYGGWYADELGRIAERAERRAIRRLVAEA